MTAISALLDKARERCSLPSDNALAQRMGISRQLVSGWRKGDTPVADDRIAQLAALAHEELGFWLVRIRADQATGDAAKGWAQVVKRLGTAAAVLLMLSGLTPAPASAQVIDSYGLKASSGAALSELSGLYIMRTRVRRWLRRVLGSLGRPLALSHA